MSTSLYINRGISNYSNSVRSNLQNPVQKSEVRKPKFDVHDKLVFGDARDRLYIARMRELEIKRKRNEISQLSYDAYVKNLKNESINEEHEFMEDDNEEHEFMEDEFMEDEFMEDDNEEHENFKSNDNSITQKLTDKYNDNYILDLIYPVGTIYSRNINELPFDYGKWELISNQNEEESEENMFQWVRIV